MTGTDGGILILHHDYHDREKPHCLSDNDNCKDNDNVNDNDSDEKSDRWSGTATLHNALYRSLFAHPGKRWRYKYICLSNCWIW